MFQLISFWSNPAIHVTNKWDKMHISKAAVYLIVFLTRSPYNQINNS